MTCPWTHIMTPAELAAHNAITASIDPSFARKERDWYESRTATQLRSSMNGAWNANDSYGYQMNRSYLAKLEG